MVSAVCQLCGAKEFGVRTDRLRGGQSGSVLECQKCGLIFRRYSQSLEEVYRFYKTDYPGNYRYRMEINGQRLTRLEPLLQSHLEVLEVGCSSGELLDLIRPRVKSVSGVELVPHDVDTARRRYELTIYDRPVEELELDTAFDLIITFQCFEHIPNPNEFLRGIRRMLRAKGKLVVEVPNVNEPLLALYGLEEFRRFYYVPQHLFYYSQETLPRMLAKNGFIPGEPQLIQMGTLTNHFHWIHKRGPQKDLAEVCTVVLPEDVLSPDALEVLRHADRLYREALVARGYSDVLWIEAKRE